MRRIIYYITTIILNITSIFVLRHHLHITAASMIPVLLLLLSAFFAFYYVHNQENNTTYSSNTNITEAEWKQVTFYMIHAHLIAIPLYIPFIWFFASWFKLFSAVLFLVAFISSNIVFRMKHGKELQDRYDQEKRELQEQKVKEDMGHWK